MPHPRLLALLAGAVLAAAVFAGALALLRGSRKAPALVRGAPVVAIAETGLERVTVRTRGAHATLERHDGGWWRISPAPPVRADAEVEALRTALGGLTRRATLAAAGADPGDLASYGLAAPRARVALGLVDGTVMEVAIGDDQGADGAGFVLAPGGDVAAVPAWAVERVLAAIGRLLPGVPPPAPGRPPDGG